MTGETKTLQKEFITGIKLVSELCRACNIDPDVTRHLRLDVDVNNVVTVTATVDMFGTKELESFGWESLLAVEKPDGPKQ